MNGKVKVHWENGGISTIFIARIIHRRKRDRKHIIWFHFVSMCILRIPFLWCFFCWLYRTLYPTYKLFCVCSQNDDGNDDEMKPHFNIEMYTPALFTKILWFCESMLWHKVNLCSTRFARMCELLCFHITCAWCVVQYYYI